MTRPMIEPVSWTTEEDLGQDLGQSCFCRGGRCCGSPLAVVEAVTARVSVLPVVGSELLTGLSAAAGVTDQLFLDSGSTLDKVGNGACQSGVCMVPAERFAGVT